MHSRLRSEIQVFDPKVCRFLDPGTSVVQEQKKGLIAQGAASVPRKMLEQRRDLLTFQEVGLGWRRTFYRDRGDSLGGLQPLRNAAGHVGEERPESRQPLIAGSNVVAPVLLKMFEEGYHPLHREILKAQSCNRTVEISGDKGQEESERIAVAPYGRRAEPFLNFQVVLKERTYNRSECRYHWGSPSSTVGWANPSKR